MAEVATKDAPKVKGAELLALVGLETIPLAELRKAVSEVEIAKAWAAGDIEFGHRQYCVTGPVGKMGSALVLEDGWDWSGPKTKMHKNYRDIITDLEAPKTQACRQYVTIPPEKFGEEPTKKAVEMDAREAHAAIALHVRLTDQGITTVQG